MGHVRNLALLTVLSSVLAARPAFADDAAVLKRLNALERTIQTQQSEIVALRKALAKQPPSQAAPAASAQPAASNSGLEQVVTRVDALEANAKMEQTIPREQSFINGRPQWKSADGRFSLALKLLGQFDAAYYMQSAASKRLPNGQDLSGGTNFRRAQIGFQGTLFGDWSYLVNTEFGGSGGTESGGRVQALYVEYDGWKQLSFRVGAYPPPGGLEDNTGATDTLFLERAAASDILRNAVGGDGRDSATLTYATDKTYAALSLTGDKVGGTAVFDEQQALLGRVAQTLWSGTDGRLVASASGAWLFKAADAAPGAFSARPVTLSSNPELTVDSTGTKLVSTGAIDTKSLSIWGVETGANWQNLYAQAGYFAYAQERRASPLPNLDFDGWYAQASWVLTGEPRGYSVANAAFTSPKPDGSLGAWELAARYSAVDLNDRSGTVGLATPFGGVRGGDQKIWTLGLNWYPNTLLRFALDWEHIEVGRLGTMPAFGGSPAKPNAQIGQTLDALSLRSQIAL